MRQVLLELALTTNGRSGGYGGRSSGGDHESAAPTLGLFDAPQEHWARKWDQAEDEVERIVVLQRARDELAEIRRGAPPLVATGEPWHITKTRIVTNGIGVSAREISIVVDCSANMVREARIEAGREPELGLMPRKWREMTEREREQALTELRDLGLSGNDIATALSCSLSTVARALGWRR
jgi:hypothetical protein